MSAMLQAAPEKPVTAPPPQTRPCPECMAGFVATQAGQLFCTPAHRDAWNNRGTVRGRVLTPLAMVARITRDGTRGDRVTGKRASSENAALIQRWRDEDAAAGRMPWPEYLRRRYAAGFDPL